MKEFRAAWGHRATPSRSALWRQAAGVVGIWAVGGCSVTEHYLIDPAQIGQVVQVPAAAAKGTALPLRKYLEPRLGHDFLGKTVFVRVDAVQQGKQEDGGAPFVLRSRRYSPVVTGGVALTVIGSLISIAGSIVFFSSFNQSGDTHLISGVIALSAEPMMLAGTLMWIYGIQRPPQEVGAGRPGMRYLDPPMSTPAPLPAPAPALSLRF